MNFDDTDDSDEDVFHPLGEAWQDDLEDVLDETEYDTELGMEMARDAMRLTAGEISEEEFHARYHEDVLEEFGEDGRPIASPDEADDEGRLQSVLSGFGVGEDSRREMMKKMGAGAGFLGLGAWGTVADDEQPEPAVEDTTETVTDEDETQWGMTLDLEHCDGCLSCVVACNEEHNWDEGANWMYILAFEDGTVESPEPDEASSVRDFNYLIRPCQHCTDAPCEKVCPTTARHTRDEGGLVLTDYDICIGCRYCQVACPYGVNYFQWDEPDVPREELEDEGVYDERGRPVSRRAPRGVMSKCVFDPARQDGNAGEEFVGTTACEEACPPEVIQFGDMNNPNSDPQRYRESPSRSRAIIQLSSQLPPADELESQLGNAGTDLGAVTDAVGALDEETIGLMKAVEMTSGDTEPPENETSSLAEQEQTVLDAFTVLEEHGLALQSEDVLVQIGVAEPSGEDEEFEGPSEELAQLRLEEFRDGPESSFKLLEEIGTNPNIVYLGNEPGPEAEQVEGPVAYEDVGMVDVRQDVLDEETVGLGLRNT